MKLNSLTINKRNIAEVTEEGVVLHTLDDALDLLGNLYYQGFDGVILHEKNLTPEFFDLQNGLAGEVLQKFSNYRLPLVVVGDFSRHHSSSLQAFIRESNNGRLVNFVATRDSAMQRFAAMPAS